MPPRGLIIAAPCSGSGKTTITLGLLRALSDTGRKVIGFKSGPDYIDPQFHSAAARTPSCNLDAWAMPRETIQRLVYGNGSDNLVVIEGAMGLYDGAPPDGKGSVADLARQLQLPVILVVNAASMAQSVAALVSGFSNFDPEVTISGVILNNVGSARHDKMLRKALAPCSVPVLGSVFRDQSLTLPSRHLGLVQAGEHADLEQFIKNAARVVSSAIDVTQIDNLAKSLRRPGSSIRRTAKSRYNRIAIAHDKAFAFLYPHLVSRWQEQGSEIEYFSPLADDPVPEADLVYLPGGYPELYADTLSKTKNFFPSLRRAADSTEIFGECGGYMVLGHTLTDADGTDHKMAGLLDLHTSFAKRKLHLGYRMLQGLDSSMSGAFTAHEFHFATTVRAVGAPLFQAWDAEGMRLKDMGLVEGNVRGSFAHIIDTIESG
jgi:cobyrinic acid a,c-diamide synthase